MGQKNNKMKEKIKKYLNLISNQEIKEFCLNKCKFVFSDYLTTPKSLVGWYVGFVNGKHLIKFYAENPKPKTFFHEVAHAYLNHKPTISEEQHEREEKEANNLAFKWLNQNV